MRKPATTTVAIDPARLARLPTLSLHHGAHRSFARGHCAMELVSWLARERWSDKPKCTSPVIGAFVRRWQDDMPDDATRTRLLRDLLPELIGTATTAADEETRAWMIFDWLVRVHTPAWLDLAGLAGEASRLRALPEFRGTVTPDVTTELLSAREKSAAAGDTAGDAAWAATWAAAGAAAGSAAWDTAGAATWAAAWDTAGAAAGAAARDTAGARLAPTVAELQTSAVELVRRMCAVGR